MTMRDDKADPCKFALFNHQGTAMAESGICYDCYQIERFKQQAREWAHASEDYDGQQFRDVSTNPDIICQFCGFDGCAEENGHERR